VRPATPRQLYCSSRTNLDRRIATLHALRTRLATCIGCGCLSIDRCSLLNADDEAATLGPGAHYLQRDSRRATTG
jgi:MerR family redox-sensitive transcriptional activator SoxR